MSKTNTLSTDPYKGVRDFPPTAYVGQTFIFEHWSHICETFGFQRYDASILEPADLYSSKTSDEIVNEQTYTFTDRGDRLVTLRPEMTPTVARLIAKNRRELKMPVRWYSIPNLFRYERPQRGRLREHWQLNADIFGSSNPATDVEIILLGASTLQRSDDVVIHINHRELMRDWFTALDIPAEKIMPLTQLIDRRNKMHEGDFETALGEFVTDAPAVLHILDSETYGDFIERTGITNDNLEAILAGLQHIGVENVVFDPSLARGFSYYTGMIFEIFDTHPENNRALLGGGRYDGLTKLFEGENADPMPAVGFGMGDVTMRDYLSVRNLLPETPDVPEIVLLPLTPAEHMEAIAIAEEIRSLQLRVTVDLSSKKIGDRISTNAAAGAIFAIPIGEDELENNSFTMKILPENTEATGNLSTLMQTIDGYYEALLQTMDENEDNS